MGSRLAHLEREAADHNSAMTTQMTERFSAPGATLVKLFGRPAREEAEFGARAERVAEIGVRTAMGQYVFLTALALVSALALALVYGLGGYAGAAGRDRGRHGRHARAAAHPALRAADRAGHRAGRRHDGPRQLRAGVRGARPGAADHRAARRRAPCPTGRSRCEFDDVRFAYPSADKVSLASLEEVATLDGRGGAEVLHGISFRVEPGQLVALVGSSGSGKSTIASLAPRLYDVDAGAVRLSGIDVRDLLVRRHPGHARAGDPGRSPVPRHRPGEPALRPARGDRRRAVGRAAHGPPGAAHRGLPDGLDTVVGERGYRFSGGERQRLTIARILLARPRVVDPRRGDRPPRLDVRGRGAGGAGRRARRSHGDRHRPPPVDDPRGRRHPRRRAGPDRRARHPRRAARGRRALRRAVPHAVRRRPGGAKRDGDEVAA